MVPFTDSETLKGEQVLWKKILDLAHTEFEGPIIHPSVQTLYSHFK